MKLFEWILNKHKNKDPLRNPFTFQFSENYSGPVLGNAGKLYKQRGKLNNNILSNGDYENWIVPSVWEKPVGFIHDGYLAWKATCETHAINHYRKYGNVQNKYKEYFNNIIKKQDVIYGLSRAIDSESKLPKLVKSTFTPRPHQKVAIEFGKLTNGNFIIADQQRTGKSYSALLYALSQDFTKVLIVCPSKVVGVWVNMISLICDCKINKLSSNSKLKDGFNIISYDSIHTIKDLTCDICIADECHFFIEDTARRSRAMNRINANKKIALSGTPIMNSINDLITVVNWIDHELGNEMKIFISSFNETEYNLSNILGEELRKRCLLLRETSQVGSSNDPYINFIKIDTKVDDPKNLQEVGKAKVNFAVEYCNSFNNQILVAFYYKETGNMLKNRLGKDAILINGESSKKEVNDAITKFKNGEVKILLGSTIIAEGLDFSFCDHILMLEESSYSMRTDQIRERVNNIHKEREVIIDIAVVPGTQDDRLYELLNNKFNLQEGLRDS